MRNSPANRITLAAAALVVALCSGAAAQTNTPRALIPGAKPATTESAPANPGGVQVNRLNAPGRAAAGLLTDDQGGLSANLWQGSSRQIIALLFQRMPATYGSPTARRVARKLLLSTGAMPAGGISDQDMLALRLNALLNMGDAESTVALAEAAGGVAASDNVARPLAEALFLLDQNDRACAVAQGQVRAGGGTFWQQVSVFCDLAADRPDTAELTLSLLNETGENDRLFDALATSMQTGGEPNIADPSGLNALHVAMLAAMPSAKVRGAEKAPVHLAPTMAGLPSLTVGQRVRAGGAAVRATGADPAAMMLLLGDKAVTSKHEPLRDAVLNVMTAVSPAVRAEALNDLWKQGVNASDRAAAAAFAAPFLKDVKPEAGIGFLAPAAMRMALLNADQGQAQGWFDLMQRAAASGDQDLLRARQDAQALAQIAGLTARDDRGLQTWIDALDGDAAADRKLKLLLALDGLGTPAGMAIWAGQLSARGSAAMTSDPALWRQMVMAAGGGRAGEAVQAVLGLLGGASPADLDARTLSTVVGALRRAGLPDEARQVVVEAMIGQGD